MLQKIRESKLTKIVSILVAQFFIFEIISPMQLWALTGGPSQPEVQSFEPVGTSQMVDLFTGDFTYNIPLIDVGGYPVNLSYHSGVTMDQEASWVGLGWNINPGVINRNMRALPDDFNGDEIKQEFNKKNNETYGVNLGLSLELAGLSMISIGVNLGLSYNNYRGYGFSMGIEPSFSSASESSGGMTASLGLSASSESGVGINPSIGYSSAIAEGKDNDQNGVSGNIGVGFNSRSGLSSVNIRYSAPINSTRIVPDINGGSSISFAYKTYTPNIELPMVNSNISLSVTLGTELFALHPNLQITGYYGRQKLKHKSEKVPAYGYLYLQEGDQDDNASLDFNREKDGVFTKHKPNLPLANLTYDIYAVSGQGISGMYRPYRSDYGIVYDRKVKNESDDISLGGLEVGVGGGVHGGLNLTINSTNSFTGKWENHNDLKDAISFRNLDYANDKYYEPFYFKQAGEKTTETDSKVFTSIGSYDPVCVALDKNDDKNVRAMDQFMYQDESKLGEIEKNHRDKRQRRNQVISTMVADLAAEYAFEEEIKNYTRNAFGIDNQGRYNNNSTITRNTGDRKGHHISEITTFRTDGMRYIYGIPAYNTTQEEVTFAITGGNPDCSTGLVSYDHGNDNTTGNNQGLDHYFNKTTMPAYAHSYLLTAVLSPDYVDIIGDGPSDDDLGSYTKFNYSLVDDNYQWRVPYSKEKANYNEGFKSIENSDSDGDDKASYIYGEKEIWYLHSIETKTHVAEFILADRCDGFESDGDIGGIGDAPMQKLLRIDLYSKQDKLDKLRNGGEATPIKSVHFEYDYSLCPHTPNNSGGTDLDEDEQPTNFDNSDKGKLTLKKVYFTYQKSNRGKLNPYRFEYAQYRDSDGNLLASVNDEYNLKSYDRWGSFMPNPENATCSESSPLTNPEFPYTPQQKIKDDDTYNEASIYEDITEKYMADLYATAWNLTSIDLPSGGKINVDYEADDYAYVQDKKAMQMFKVVGVAENETNAQGGIYDNELYKGASGGMTSNSFLIVELANPYTKSLTSSNFKADFLTTEKNELIEYIYFRFLLDVSRGISPDAWEYISGYATPEDLNNTSNYGFIDDTKAYIKLENVDINDETNRPPKVNQISQAGWNFVKVYMPRIAYGKAELGGGVLEIFGAIASSFEQIMDLFTGFYNKLRFNSCSRYFNTDKSWVRLYNPDQIKKGGGHRVKKIELSDQWSELTKLSNYSTASYGQEYDYTVLNDNNEIISSGVAAYEPIVGGDENPFKQPVTYREENLLVPGDDYYMEEPFGESYFPGASVGYRQVTVRNLQYDGVTKNATGKVIHEFYTAKDFPTRTDQTSVKKAPKKDDAVMKLLKIKTHDFMTATQGYVIELNDMHGKQKSQKVYSQSGDAISGVSYKYKSYNGKLINEVDVVEKDGTISTQTVGVDHDFVVDMREQETQTVTAGINGNLDFFMAAIFPVVIPMVLPKYAEETVRYRSAVTTKVINRYGILESVTAFEHGSTITTKNKLYDAETGEVLLTETQNQYDDDVYSFTYPAHWAYERMGPAYKNIGVVYQGVNDGLVEGDEVVFDGNRGWVANVEGGLKILSEDGEYYSNPSEMQVVRSGRKNRQTLSIGSINSLADPISSGSLNFSKVLNASAMEYTDEAGVFCGECGLEPDMEYNPYIVGSRGIWKQQKSYVYLTDRTQSRANNNTNIRRDGIYKDFSPFWTAYNGQDWNKNLSNPKWVYSSEVTIFSPYGTALENRDALGRYSSAVYGYNQILPVANAANAMYKEIAFDGFEDYDLDLCDKDHFSFEYSINEGSPDEVSINIDEAHTGRKSIRVKAGVTVGVRKVVIPCEDEKKK